MTTDGPSFRWIKGRRVFDLGTSYLPITGVERTLRRRRNWTDEEESDA